MHDLTIFYAEGCRDGAQLLGERLLRADQVRAAAAAGQLERPLIEGDAGGAVWSAASCAKAPTTSSTPASQPAARRLPTLSPPEREAHGAVDPLEDPRQNLLPLDEHDAADARRPARYPLRDTDDFHSALPIPHPDAVVPGTELVPHLPTATPRTPRREKAPSARAAASS